MIKSLQGLRVLAMLAIFFYHSGFIPNGIFPVTFFFILTGFVLYYNYNSSLEVESIKESVFWGVTKIKKMYPIHVITFLMSIIIRFDWVAKFTTSEFFLTSISTLLLLNTTTPKYQYVYNAASWYLATIFWCYLFLPLIITKMKKIKIKTEYLIVAVYAFQIVLASITSRYLDSYLWFLYLSPYFRIFDVILGMLVAKLYIEKDKSRYKSNNMIELAIIGVFLVAYRISFRMPVEFTKGIIYTPAFLLAFYFISQEKGVISKFLTNDVFQKTAKISFEFYMVHELILILFSKIFQQMPYHWTTKMIFIVTPSLIISFILAYLLNKYVTGFNKNTKKLFNKKNKKLVEAR